jgi:hypothetical protein
MACKKLNILGGEYEVLEALVHSFEIRLFHCLLVQFHRLPAGYIQQHEAIPQALICTHICRYAFRQLW